MKKIIFTILISIMCLSSVFGQTTNWPIFNRPTSDWFSASDTPRNVPLMWMRAIDPLIAAGVDAAGTGSIFYVDSGVTNAGDGSSWTNAVATLDEGVDLCTAHAGDIIYVAQGHNEAMDAGDDVDVDVNGVTIVGCGVGDMRPRFDYDDTDGEFVIGASGVHIYNLTFLPSNTSIVFAINVEAAGDYAVIENCEFLQSETVNTDEFLDTIKIATGATDVLVLNNRMTHTTSSATCNNFVDLSDTTLSRPSVIGNYVYGNFVEAPIWAGSAVPTECLIAYNVITNLETQLAIEFTGNATGWCIGNIVSTDGLANSIDAGRMGLWENYWADLDAYDATAVPYTTNHTGVNRWGVTELAQIEAEATDALEADELEVLVNAADSDSPANSSIISHLASATEDWSTFAPTTDSLEAIRNRIDALTGLYFRGAVTTGGTTAQVISTDLAGFGDEYFMTNWVMVSVQDAGGAQGAPEGEIRDITNYISTSGTFTCTAFSQAHDVGDEVMVMRREWFAIDQVALLAAPIAGSLTNYIAGTGSIGTDLGTGNSLVDVLGSDGVVTTTADAGSLLGAIGTNEAAADTPFTSSTAEADRDGSLIERNEKIIELLETGTLNKLTAPASTYSILDILGSDGADATGAVAGSIIGAIGTDEAASATAFASTSTEADADGSVLEREEWLQTEMAKIPKSDSTVTWNATAMQDIEDEVQDSIQAEQLDHLGNTATGGADFTTEVADGTVLSRIITSDADTSGYNLATDSLEAISDILWGGAGIAAWPTAAAYSNDISIAEVLAYVQDGVRRGSGATLPANKSLFDIIGETYTDDGGTDDVDDVYSHLKIIFDQLAGLATGGEVFYVDSGGGGADSSGYGVSWAMPCLTVDYAESLCTANRGDIIMCAPGHAENITAAGTDLTMGTAGITVIGIGLGTDQPTFTFTTDTGADIEIDASCSFYNIAFDVASLDAILAAIDVDAADVEFHNCTFTVADAAAQAVTTIELDGNADRLLLNDCTFIGGSNDGPGSVITFVATAPDYVRIYDCWFDADCDNAVIYGTSTISNLIIKDSHICNRDAGEHAIELTGNATGIIKNCTVSTDTYATAIDPGTCMTFNTLWYDSDVPADATGIPVLGISAGGAVTLPDTDLANIEAEATDALEADSLDKLASADDSTGATAYPDSVVQDSILAYIMGDDTNPVVTTYNNTTDSLEALGNRVAASARQSDVTTSIEADLLDHFQSVAIADVTGEKDIAVGEVATNSVLAQALTVGGTAANFDPRTDSLEGLSNLIETVLSSAGDIFYVDDSGSDDTVANGHGKSWAAPFDTIDYAMSQCTANNGDVILVAAGHTTTLGATQESYSENGITIIGMGTGGDMATIVFDDAASEIDITGASTKLINLRFNSTTIDTTIGLDIEDAADGTTISHCEFINAAGFEFVIAIDIKGGADRITIENCTIVNTTGANATAAINCTDDVCDRVRIIGNHIIGKYDNASIYSDDIDTNWLIKDNIISNDETGIHCIEFTTTASGQIINNMLYSDSYGVALDPGSMSCFGNKHVYAVDMGAIDVPLIPGKQYTLMAAPASILAASDPLFNIGGGPITIVDFYGVVTSQIGASDLTVQSIDTATTTTFPYSTTVACDSDVVGTTYTFTGAVPSVLTPLTGAHNRSGTPPIQWYAPIGTVEILGDAAVSGVVEWYMTFVPLTTGVVITDAT